jgi:hypothetical protein
MYSTFPYMLSMEYEQGRLTNSLQILRPTETLLASVVHRILLV